MKNSISVCNRQLSFEDIKPKRLTKYMQILEIIGDKNMTCREVLDQMMIRKDENNKPYASRYDLNIVRPRISELVNEYGELVECDNKKDYATSKTVTVFRKTTAQEKMEFENREYISRID